MKKPYIPKGVDQQGRYSEAAEAATDLGLDEPPEHDPVRVIFIDAAIAAIVIMAIAVIVWRVI